MRRKAPRSISVIIALLLALIVPFNILGLLSSKISNQNAHDRVEDMITYSMQSYVGILNDRLENVSDTLYDLSKNNSDFLTIAKQNDTWRYTFSKYQVYTDMRNQIAVSNSADQFFLYLSKIDDFLLIPYLSLAASPYSNNLSEDDLLLLVKNCGRNLGKWVLIDSGASPILVKTCYLPSSEVYYGACIDLEPILDDLSEAIAFETIEFTFSAEERRSAGEYIAWNVQAQEGLYLNAAISQKEMGQSISPLQQIITGLFCACLLLVPVLYLLIKRYVVQPLAELNHAHDALAAGNEGYRITANASSLEFENAFQSFNSMATTLQVLRHDIVDKELANKQLQIDYLQLQIRPHFLLNTFNVLFTLIQKNHRQSAQDLVLYLSDYFRYIFRSGHEMQPFENEYKLIRGYLEVSKICYPDLFTVSYQLDPMVFLLEVPPLLLHSFFENIIQHALVPGREVHIVFSGEYCDDVVTFLISDDGNGMRAEAMDIVNEPDEAKIPEGKSVGLLNAIKRLRHCYGEKAGVFVESAVGQGTTFTITIPCHLEDNENESIACE